LLLEDYPKFASTASRGTERSEYAQHTRKLSMNAQRDTARNVIRGLQTPAMTPGLGTSRQLGVAAEDRRPKTSEGVITAPFGSFGGFTPAKSSNNDNRPTTSSDASISASKPAPTTNGLGLYSKQGLRSGTKQVCEPRFSSGCCKYQCPCNFGGSDRL